MHSDPIADMLTRIRNAASSGKKTVMIRASKICMGIAEVLKAEGYIAGFDKIDDATGQGLLKVELKYTLNGISAINEIQRISKPGKRVYSNVSELPHIMNGMGIAIVSTNKGVMTDNRCRQENVSGEILCMVN